MPGKFDKGQSALQVVVAWVGLFLAQSALAGSKAITIALDDAVLPPMVSSGSLFGIASLDSIGDSYGIEALVSCVPNPPELAAEVPLTSRMYVAYFPDTMCALDVATAYEGSALVFEAIPDTVSNVFFSLPTDAYFQNEWMLHNSGQTFWGSQVNSDTTDIDAPEAWEFTAGSSSIVVAVIDREIDQGHPDLSPRLWVNPGDATDDNSDNDGNGFEDDIHGWDFDENDGDTSEHAGRVVEDHGTSVAGILVGQNHSGAGNTGIVGVANRACKDFCVSGRCHRSRFALRTRPTGGSARCASS